MFLSNQRQVAFRWAFSVALPKLLGVDCLDLVKCVMTDGDSWEIVEMEEAIDRHMPNAKRLRCSWHIIHKGWTNNCGGLVHAVPRSLAVESLL